MIIVACTAIFSTLFALNTDLANQVITAKYFWFYGAMGICTLIVMVCLCFKKNIAFRFSFSDLLVLLFVLTGILPYFFRSEKIDTNFILFALLAVLYFYFRLFLSLEKNARQIISFVLIITALLEGIWGLLQLYGFQPSQHTLFRLTGTFFNPGPYAGYLAAVVPMAFFYLLKKHENNVQLVFRIIAILTLTAVLLVLPASMSRAAWLATVFGCGFVIIQNLKFKIHSSLQSTVGIFLSRIRAFISSRTLRSVLKIFCVIFALSALFAMYHLKKDSADGRMLIWKNTVETVKQNPAGVGLGHFGGSYAKAQAAYFTAENATEQEQLVAGNPEYAFNEYLQIAAEQGIAGLFVFLAVLFLAFYKGIKNKNYGAVGALLSLSVFAFFSYPFRILPCLILLVFLLADCNTNFAKKNMSSRFRAFALFTFCIVVAFCLYNRYPTYNACKEWKNLKMLYQMQIYDNLPKDYERLSPFLNDQSDFLFEYGQCLSKTGNYEKSNEILAKGMSHSGDPMFYNITGKNFQALKNYEKAAENYLMAASIVPHKLYPYYLLAKLYAETGDTLKFRQAAALVMSKEPKVQSTAIKEMREEILAICRDGDLSRPMPINKK